jgi:phosphatidylserine decarboxylase
MRTPARSALSRLVGWIADRRVPGPFRAPLYKGFARCTGADLSEVQDPLVSHRTFTEFFVRRLKDGARPVDADASAIVSPCDGTLFGLCPVDRGTLIQAKGRSYPLAEFLGSAADAEGCEGGLAWTIYLSPRDYHRVHAPETCALASVRRIQGARYSVAPVVLEARLVLPVNERAVFRLETGRGVLWMVMVGATNVGRIRVVGEGPRGTRADQNGLPRRFLRGEEIARFEMGSTVVLVAPRGLADAWPSVAPVRALRLGERIATWRSRTGAARA